MRLKIAVIGSGIAGLTSAYILSKRHDVTLFEANNYLGGHTNTVTVDLAGRSYNIDTGFIVFNKKTYPNFCKLLTELDVPMQLSEMSFSYRSTENNFEYNGHNLNTFFSKRRNLFKPSFYNFAWQILKFNRDAKAFLAHAIPRNITIEEFLRCHKYSAAFVDYYFIPMMASIWSKNKSDTLNCDAYFILKFYQQHGLIDIFDRPAWYVIKNGSKSYIPSLLANISSQHLDTKILRIERETKGVSLHSSQGQFNFDKVFVATHSDQALEMLEQPSQAEVNVLSSIKLTANEVVLHCDESVMPKRKLSWASWNYLDCGSSTPTLTYYMNLLQSIKSEQSFFVSLNLNSHIAENKILKKIRYTHPCLDLVATEAQQKIGEINGINNTYYVGSYWGFGFHEDGVTSALKACKLLDSSYA